MVEETPSIAGPGFINVRLSAKWLESQLLTLKDDSRLGIERTKEPQTVVVDYSAPNVAKQMHVGNLRSTIIGDCLARVLEFLGNTVIRQNHIGDWGTQFGMLIAHLKGLGSDGEARIEDLDRFYKEARQRFDADPQFADQARANVVQLQAGGKEEIALWEKIVEATRRYYEPIYKQLGVKLTRGDEKGESFYNPMLPSVVADLEKSSVAIESEGAIVAFTKGYEAPLIIEKRGGGYGYAATDLAAVRHRINDLHANRIIYVVGSPQSQHLQQVFAAAKNAGWTTNVVLEHATFGSVLGEDGKMFKTRSGESVKLKELLNEAEERALKVVTEKNPDLPEAQRKQVAHAVGIGAVKYADLSKDRINDYVFSWEKMLSFDGNTAPYLQNAYVRVHGIFRKAKSMGIDVKLDYSAIQIESPFEIAIAKHVLRIGEIIEIVARDLKPHTLCTYLYDLATKYHAFFENCPVLQSDELTRSSRLALCDITARTLALGLDLLGIEHPEQM